MTDLHRALLYRVTPLVLASAVFSFGLDWGLPRRSWADLVMRYEARDAIYMEEMSRARARDLDELWAESGARSVAGLRRHRQGGAEAAGRLDEVERYDILHKFLIGSRGYDETSLLATIQRMYREGHGFDPRNYRYGGGFLYPAAAALFVGHLVGAVPASVPAKALLAGPERMRGPYVTLRVMSTLALIGAAAATGWLAQRRFGGQAWFGAAVAMVALSPLAVAFSHSAKPYALVTALGAACLMAAHLYEQRGSRRWLVISASCAGWATSALVPCAPLVLLPATIVLLDPSERWPKRLACCLAWVILPCVVTFLVFSPYLMINPTGFLETVRGAAGDWGYGWHFGLEAPRQVVEGLLRGMGLAGSVCLPLAWVLAARSTDRWERAAALTTAVGLVLGVCYFGPSPRFTMYLLPACVLLACGAARRLTDRSRPTWQRVSAIGVLAALLSTNFVLAFDSLRGLNSERKGEVERQVFRYLEGHEVEGEVAALDEKLRPFSHVPFPLFGVSWHHIETCAGWGDEVQPSVLLLSKPLAPTHCGMAGSYELRETFGVPQAALHRLLTDSQDWFRKTYLYTPQPGSGGGPP